MYYSTGDCFRRGNLDYSCRNLLKIGAELVSYGSFQGSRDFGRSLLMILTAVETPWLGSTVFTTLDLSFNPMGDESTRAYCLKKNSERA